MRAVALKGFGGTDVLSVVTNAARPQLRPHEVLINVKATSVNRGDIMQRKGHYPPPPGASEILGLEASGVVCEVGSEVKRNDIKVGDRVMALLSGGGYAEYASVPAGHLLPIPSHCDFEEGAAISEVFLTAWQCLRLNMDVQKGQKVLIHAGASGVGTAAAQLCKKVIGATSITTSSTKKVQECLKYADYAVSRELENDSIFKDKLYKLFSDKPDINAVIDPVFGGGYLEETVACCANDATITILAMMGGSKIPNFSAAQLFRKRINLKFSTLRSRSDEYKDSLVKSFMEEALPLFEKSVPEDKRLVPVIHSVFPLEKVAEAHKLVDDNDTVGKVILKL